ncbi:tetratricopeptide repeat protein [Kordiimonas laminariae]|uniref:tetratricopeptide repeat protein n=1 Tax=Kordiimonas laminariae TaxID=2917717 RepID=UPI001FF45B81|nr:tetratricopeptide repeat protein [Kordiimonas laminariae]MCK0069143.1 tetratricopeptide repeat protein [Kordiimonas laminariae]
MKRNSLFTVLASAVILVSCDSSIEEGNKDSTSVDPRDYDLVAIEQVIDAGDSIKAIEILTARSQLGLATSAELMKLAELYLKNGQGVAAAVAVEQARRHGLSRSKSALLLAKAYLLGEEFSKAERELALVSLQGDEGFEAILLKGDVAQKRERFEEARKLFSIAAEIKPESNLPDNALAFMELHLGNLAEAEKFALLANEKNPNDLTAQYILGAVKRYMGQQEEAEKILSEILDENPRYYTALIELAGVYLDLQNFEEVEKLLDVISQVIPGNTMALYYSAALATQAEEYEEAEKILVRLNELRNSYLPAKRLYAYVLYKVGKYDVANALLRSIIQVTPNDTVIRRALADSLIQTNKNEEAMEVLAYLTKSNTNDDMANMQIAVALAQEGKLEESADYFSRITEQGIPLEEDKKRLYRSMIESQSMAEFIAGNASKAIGILQDLMKSGVAESKQLLTLANMQMEVGSLNDASATLELLKEKDPENIAIHNLAGTIEHRRGRYQQAVVHYGTALALNPKYDSAVKNRASAYMAMRRYADANRDLVELIERASGDPQVQGMLGESYLELENYREAVRTLERTVEMLPQSPRYSFLLTKAFAGNKQVDEAINQAEVTMRLVKGDKEAETYLRRMITELKDKKAFVG